MGSYSCLWLLCVAHASIISEKRFKPPDDHRVRIAVIGAGIGGSSFVHYFNQLNQDSVAFVMDIYERNDYIGGRTKSIHIEGDAVEIGASILIRDNQNMLQLVKDLQLHTKFIKQHTKKGKTAIWNARSAQFSFVSYSGNSWLSLPYALWHFSPKKLLDLYLLSTSFVHKMNGMYEYQNASRTLNETEAFYEVMNVLSLSQINGFEYLYQQLYGVMTGVNIRTKEGIYSSTKEEFEKKLSESAILNELVTAIIRANYNQNFYEMNALVCMTALGALAGDGAHGIWSVMEGNQQVAQRMIQNAMRYNDDDDNNASQSNLRLGKEVVSIMKLNSNSKYRYKVTYRYGSGRIGYKHYDIIVIAAPIATMKCDFVGFDDIFYKNLKVAQRVLYQTVFTTIIEGELKQSYFVKGATKMTGGEFNKITDLLIGDYYDGNEGRVFNSIRLIKVLRNNSKIYKIFSRYSLKYHAENVLDDMFVWHNEHNVIEQHWNASAYPKYSEKTVFPKIVMDTNVHKKLNGRIYYNNAVEAGASAMEITVISAYNIALLLREYLACEWFKTNVNFKEEL